jgi:hypothetical protein
MTDEDRDVYRLRGWLKRRGMNRTNYHFGVLQRRDLILGSSDYPSQIEEMLRTKRITLKDDSL